MPTRHLVLAISVAVIWGVNFIAIDYSLDTFDPMLLVALRFGLIAVPTIMFVPRPEVPARWLIGYGVGFGLLQFAFLYWGMATGMPAGLASLVLQASAPFTVMLGATFLRERLSPRAIVGVLVAVAGLTVVGWQRAEHAAIAPFLLTVTAAFGWAIGNVCNRQARSADPFRLMLWMTVVPPLPMLAVSLLAEGPESVSSSIHAIFTLSALPSVLGLMFTVVVATVLGSGVWTWLMSKHPASVVAPFSMLVPVVGMTAAWIMLGERVRSVEAIGAALVVCGVLLGSVTRRPSGRAERIDRGREPQDGGAEGRHRRDVEGAAPNLQQPHAGRRE